MYLIAALGLGFFGSFHCIGMCGPIALALPLDRTSFKSIFFGSMVYNLGRVLSYAVLGVLIGTVGYGINLAGYQNAITISIGMFLLLTAFIHFPFLKKIKSKLLNNKLLFRIKSGIYTRFKKSSLVSLGTIGLLNGFLPCGFVYLALSATFVMPTISHSVLFMLFFGFGTLPALLLVNLMSGSISSSFRTKISTWSPIIVCVMALLLIVRGLDLGIPYISPKSTKQKIVIKNDKGKIENKEFCIQDCCKK